MITLFNRARRCYCAAIGLIVVLVSASAFAQSIVVGPARPGGNPMQASTTAFPIPQATTVFPVGGTVQPGAPTGACQVNSAALTGSCAFTVINSTYAGIQWLGIKGQDTNQVADNCYLTVVRTNATTVTVTCNRTTIGNSDGPANPAFSVEDLNGSLVDSVQWGTATTVTPLTITACPAGTSKTEVQILGLGPVNASGDAFRGYLTLASATSVTLTANTANTIAGVQVICWK